MKTILIPFALALLPGRAAPAETISWRQTEHALALLNGTNVVWQIVADPAQGKPYFHPLATPDGTLLTDLRPADHPWHRGLWFSWKFINGLNYWEEDRQTRRSQGATELVAEKLQPHADGSATFNFSLRYHPWNAPALLTEQRTVAITAPVHGHYEINWTSEFTAVAQVSLTRTPPPGEPGGKSYGGYAGLSLRLNQSTAGWTFSNDSGATGSAALHGQPAGWVKFSAGANCPAVTIFDSVENLHHPSPWYVNQHYRIRITDHDHPDELSN